MVVIKEYLFIKNKPLQAVYKNKMESILNCIVVNSQMLNSKFKVIDKLEMVVRLQILVLEI